MSPEAIVSERWRQLTLDDGTVLQIVLSHHWLVIEP